MLRPLLRISGLLFAISIPAVACADSSDAQPATADLVAAAERLCPPMWEWVKAIGDSFNGAASDVRTIDAASDRRKRWFTAFAEMRALNASLVATIEPWADDSILDPIVAEILRDLPRSNNEINDLELLFTEFPELDEQRHQERTQQLIVRVEKVIDLPKPELTTVDPTGALGAAFATVPSCQHSVKDADDGHGRFNG